MEKHQVFESPQDEGFEILEHNLYVADKGIEDFEMLENMEHFGKQDVKQVGKEVCEALNELIVSKKAPKKLAGVHSKLVSMAYKTILEENRSPEITVSQLMGKITKEAQENMKRGDYAFTNEDLYSQFGRTREKGVLSDIKYLLSEANESSVYDKKHYSNALLDNTYGIDYITASINKNTREIFFDLVQVKSDMGRLMKRDVDLIILKHMNFVKKFKVMFEDFKVKEANNEDVEKLEESLGLEKALSLRETWDMAQLADTEEEGKEWLLDALNEFKSSVVDNKEYGQTPNAAKYSYVHDLGKENLIDEDPNINTSLGVEFKRWQNDWLSEIKVKKERVMKPVDDKINYRIVIFSGDGEKDVYTID